MKNTLSYIAFALVASTSTAAFALPAEPGPCALVDCAEGEICEVVTAECVCVEPQPGGEGEDPPPCECDAPEPMAVCVPAPPPACDSDSDCGSDLVCVTYSFGSCSGGDAEPVEPNCDPDDEECDAGDPQPEPVPEPDPCVEETESICVPKYAAPCQAASDCGSGFTCETPEICTCTTSGPVEICEAEDGSDCSEIPPEDDCTCQGDAYCELIPVECTSNEDCGEGTSCLSQGDTRAAIACDPDSNCDEMGPIPSTSYCVPDGYENWAAGGGTDHVGGREVESAERTSFFNPGKNSGTDTKESAGGCSVRQGPTGFAATSLILFGLVFGLRRRKK